MKATVNRLSREIWLEYLLASLRSAYVTSPPRNSQIKEGWGDSDHVLERLYDLDQVELM